MAAGKLGAAALTTANVDTAIYTVPASTVATVSISACNKGAAAAKVRIAVGVGSAGAPTAADFLEYDTSVPANGVLERSGVVCSAGEKVFVRASTADVSVRVHGFEEAA
jgi:hypothetical protein